MTETYEVLALQYAHSIRPSRDYFLFSDPHDGPAPIVYYVWLIRNAQRTILVDTGFSAERAKARGRDFIRCPSDAVRAVGSDPDAIDTAVITHLHYDHAGNLDRFPAATFWLQDAEMRHATGRAMTHKPLRAPFELEDVQQMVAHVYGDRARFIDGNGPLAPGIDLHLIPGHSPGLQSLTVNTARGRLCLASDAAHFYANISEDSPFPILTDVVGVLEGHRRVQDLAETPDHLIPGHDPAVMDRFPKHPDDPLSVIVSEAPIA